jgi:hypothetical protein
MSDNVLARVALRLLKCPFDSVVFDSKLELRS